MSWSSDTLNLIHTLAQTSDQVLSGASQSPAGTGSTGTAAPGAAPASGAPGGPSLILFFLPVLALIIFFQITAGRKEKKKREALLNAVKKNDKVITLGGMIGTVAEIRDDEIVLRVDENSNTKVRFTRSAIQQVLTSSDTADNGTPANIEVKTKSPDRVNA